MKLFGGSSKSRHCENKKYVTTDVDTDYERPVRKRKKKGKAKIVILIIVLLLAIAAAAGAYFLKDWIEPPDVPNISGNQMGTNTEDPNDGSTEQNKNTGRQKYTFAVLGTDDGNGNTDTIMIAMFDTVDYKLNVVSIPRDTLVNVSWNVKKVNSLYGVGGIERTMDGLADIIGFDLDFYVMVDIEAFVKLIDGIGGVYYDVPVNMRYNDPAQDLYINIQKGPQMLSGSEAVKVMRFRSGYSDADIGRIDTQQDFLYTAAQQIMENTSKLNISTLADVFINNVETNLTYGNVIWFAQEFLKMDMENVSFEKIPANYWDSVYGASYVTIYVDEWVALVNEKLNPYGVDVSASDMNILTRDPDTKRIYSTSGVYAGKSSWGNGSSSAAASNTSSVSGTTPPEHDDQPSGTDSTVPNTPNVSDTPNTPNTPNVSDTPNTPNTPDVSDTPNAPDTPDVPDTPDIPNTPDVPNTPSIPTVSPGAGWTPPDFGSDGDPLTGTE